MFLMRNAHTVIYCGLYIDTTTLNNIFLQLRMSPARMINSGSIYQNAVQIKPYDVAMQPFLSIRNLFRDTEMVF